MSAWSTIATAVAVKWGVEEDLWVRDRMSNRDKDEDGTVDAINDDRLNNRSVEEKEFKNGDMAVQFGGKGVAGNAVAKFGKADDTEGLSNDAEKAADEFAQIIDAIKHSGAANLILGNDEFNFKDIADAMGAKGPVQGGAREIIGSIGEDVDLAFPVSERANGDWAVNAKGQPVGGNAVALFATEAEAEQFAELMDLMEDAGLQDAMFL